MPSLTPHSLFIMLAVGIYGVLKNDEKRTKIKLNQSKILTMKVLQGIITSPRERIDQTNT